MTTATGTLVFGGIIAWSIYRRVRRNIGRQPLRPTRIVISLVVLILVTMLLLAVSLQFGFPKLLLGLGGGIALGIPLGFVGLRMTKFEATDQGHFFIPNMYIGVTLSLLVVARMLYGYWLRSSVGISPGQPQLFQSPLTLFVLGLTIGYYLVYRIGLFVHLHDKKQLPQ